jgi:hypothetical protein
MAPPQAKVAAVAEVQQDLMASVKMVVSPLGVLPAAAAAVTEAVPPAQIIPVRLVGQVETTPCLLGAALVAPVVL